VCCEEFFDLSLFKIVFIIIVTFNCFFLIDIIILIMKKCFKTKHWRLSRAIRCISIQQQKEVQSNYEYLLRHVLLIKLIDTSGWMNICLVIRMVTSTAVIVRRSSRWIEMRWSLVWSIPLDKKMKILMVRKLNYQSRRGRLLCGGGLISYRFGLRLYLGGKSRPDDPPLPGYCLRN